jgi:hypothetical protein
MDADMDKSKRKPVIIILLVSFILIVAIYLLQAYDDSIDYNPFIPIAACGSKDEIFIIGYGYDERSGVLLSSDIYVLDKNRSNMLLYGDMTLTDSLVFVNVAMDKEDNLFAIVRKQEDEIVYEIWKIINGIVIEKYDITNSIDEENNGGILAFVIDGNGDFFIREFFSDDVIVINEKGFEIYRIKDVSTSTSFESMTMGKDGHIYALFYEIIESRSIYRVVSYTGRTTNEISVGSILPSEEIYSVLGTGTEYDLIMKGIDGVYGYSFGSVAAENIFIFPPHKARFTKSFFAGGELYMFFIEVDDSNLYRVSSVELKSLNLITGVFRQNFHTIY